MGGDPPYSWKKGGDPLGTLGTPGIPPGDPPDSREKGGDPPYKVVSGPKIFTVMAPQAKIVNIELLTSAQNVSGAPQNVIFY